ncbi:MAG: BamA/TamA family outer membrane protein [Bacteroidota bacterium]
MKQLIVHTLFLVSIILLASCSATKNLPPGETLYVGSKIKTEVTDKADKKEVKELEKQLKDLLRPKPNTAILGIRYKLFFYNLIKNPPKKQKGIKYFIKNKLGEPPVLGSDVNIEKNALLLQNRLENRGYFSSAVAGDTLVKNRKLTVLYNVKLSPRYYIRNVSYPTDSSDLSKEIRRITRGSRLKPGDPYDLDIVKEERTRIDTRLKNRGFYYFSEENLIVNVDTVDADKGEHKVDMRVEIKKETPLAARAIYKINDIVVYADYSLESDTGITFNAETYDGYKIVDPLKKYKPFIFSRSLVFHKGDIYKRNDHNLSLSRLVDLGVFKFVKVRFEDTDTVKGDFLNAFYYLSPTKKKSIRTEVSALTKSNNSNGTELTVSWRNRNLLRGAELLTVSAFAGAEKQVLSGQNNVNTIRYGAELNLFVPRIIGLVRFKTNSGFVPKTKATLSYELFSRSSQYKLNSFKASLGYVFKDDITREHQFNIFSATYVNPGRINPDFQKQLDANITLRRSIERQFILGPNYNYNINTQARNNRKRNNFYFNGNIDVAGNLLGLATGASIKKGKQKTLFGAPFSQYTRLEVDARHYIRIAKAPTTLVATRLLMGTGFSYGNSDRMPFVKQFFIGGTNSLRAFRARSLGPGKYYAGNAVLAGGFLPDQPGDIKIEANTELRAKLFSIVHGAIFFDAGNIWLTREDSTRPGGKFSKDFIKEMAVGTGLGLRFDIKFLVLRVDVAFPLRKPYLTGGPAWVIKQIDLGNNVWRKENLVYNLAIGYPF